MREIRTRIAQRSGIELSNQQIQELAARRLEAILDPRGLKPELLDQLRRSAGERSVSVEVVPAGSAQSYPFDEAALYDSPNPLLRFMLMTRNKLREQLGESGRQYVRQYYRWDAVLGRFERLVTLVRARS